MKDTPLPLVVEAMTQVGLPAVSGAERNTSSRAWMSCPSTVRTSQPKERHFSSRGSRALTSSVLAPFWARLRSTTATRVSRLREAAEHGGFPVAAFLEFAVAGQDEGSSGGALDTGAECGADAEGEAVAE